MKNFISFQVSKIKKALSIEIVALSMLATFFFELLDMLGLFSANQLKALGAFVLLWFFDWISKRHQYSKHFGSIKKARYYGAWRSRINSTLFGWKIGRYTIMYFGSACFLKACELTGVFEVSVAGFTISKEILLIFIICIMCSIEFQSIFENLTKPIGLSEKKNWEDPRIQPLANFKMSKEEEQKYNSIHSIATFGMSTINRFVANIKIKKKGDDNNE